MSYAARAFTFSPRAGQMVRYAARQSPRWARAGGRLIRRPLRRYPITSVLNAGAVGTLVPSARQRQAARQFVNSRRKQMLKNRIGERVGTGTAKYSEVQAGFANNDPETLYQVPLLNISKSTTGSENLNKRERDLVNFRGIKICMNFRVEGAIGTAKAWMNIAILSPKANYTSSDTLAAPEFFRNPAGTDRDISFTDPTLTNLDYRCLNINSDAYNIHKRRRFLLGPTQSTEGKKDRLIEFYYPLKRQIRYDAGSVYPEGKNMYLVWWYSTSDGGTPAGAVRCQYSLRKYFREPKN